MTNCVSDLIPFNKYVPECCMWPFFPSQDFSVVCTRSKNQCSTAIGTSVKLTGKSEKFFGICIFIRCSGNFTSARKSCALKNLPVDCPNARSVGCSYVANIMSCMFMKSWCTSGRIRSCIGCLEWVRWMDGWMDAKNLSLLCWASARR